MGKLVVIISGPPGAGSTTMSTEIAKKLNLRLFSPGKKYKGNVKTYESKAALDFWKTKRGKSRELHRNLDEEQIEAAKRGNVVLCGKLSIHFLKDRATHKIWLDVPIKVRAQRTSERDGISYGQALKEVKQRQEMERKNFKRIYGFDYFGLKKKADFVIDTSGLSIEQSVKRILNFIKKSG